MMGKVYERLHWLMLDRRQLGRTIAGFRASPRTFASPDCVFGEYSRLHGDACLYNVRLGRFSYVAGGTVKNASIGNFASIGPDVLVGGLGRHPTRWISTHPAFYSTRGQTSLWFADRDHFDEYRPVRIGSDVWIGARAIVLDGVTVGDGALVAAASVVTRDVAPYEIVAGAPARRVRSRFPAEQVAALLELQWWNADERTLRQNAHLFRSQDIARFLAEFPGQGAWHAMPGPAGDASGSPPGRDVVSTRARSEETER